MRPDLLILSFDTSAAHCAAALVSGDGLLAERFEEMAKGQAERLLPMLEECLHAAGARWGDLDALAVGTGPGNFTGVRLSVAAARGLALGLSIPAIGVTGLEAMAEGLDRPCLAALDARQGRIYLQGFGTGDDGPQLLQAPADLPPALHHLPVTGDSAAGAIAAAGGAPTIPPLWPLAEAIGRVALRRLPDGAHRRPSPLYLRPADALPARQAPPPILP